MTINRFLLLLFGCSLLPAAAQQYASPLSIPLQLSGNFGELRANHFHSGLDFKTEQVTGKPVVAVEGGFVSRIAVNQLGYGKVVYIDHPDGYTTVYAHLDRFAPAIERYLYRQQMTQQTYLIDVKVPPDSLPVKRGQEIARSGNTGGSAGPHLHFEMRHTASEEPIDPLPLYRNRLKDSHPPVVQAVELLPIATRGVVDSIGNKKTFTVASPTAGVYRINAPISAWGEVGVALRCHDLMDGVSNIYGVKKIRLFVDSTLIFGSSVDQFSFNETRYVNSLIDYVAWKDEKKFYQKCYLDPGNRLSFVEAVERGIIRIDEERTYRIRVELEDDYENRSRLEMTLVGQQQELPPEPPCENLLSWRTANRFREKGIDFELPRGAVYDSFCFNFAVDEAENPLAGVYTLHNDETPLHAYCRLALHLNRDSLANKAQYGLEKRTPKGGVWVGGVYKQGWVEGEVREFGVYTVAIDSLPPKIAPAGDPKQWVAKKRIELRLSDNRSGIAGYKVYLDGEFILFEIDKRNGLSTDLSHIAPTGKSRQLTIEATDKCGNTAYYKTDFIW